MITAVKGVGGACLDSLSDLGTTAGDSAVGEPADDSMAESGKGRLDKAESAASSCLSAAGKGRLHMGSYDRRNGF